MPKGKKGVTNPAVRRAMPAKEDAIVGDCLVFINSKITKRKNSPRLYPTNEDTIRYLRHAYAMTESDAVEVLRKAKLVNAERVTALMPTLPMNVISELQENVAEARRSGDLATAGRCLIALGRFCGLDGPQANPEQQVRQLSDAALEAALEASIARKLELMSDDAFDDLRRRREMKRLTEAKPAGAEPPMQPIEVEHREGPSAP